MSSATPMIDTSQIPTTNSVSRSRFFSTTVEPERLDWTPPPNRVDRPPPLARCSSTSNTTNKLVTTRVICRANSMAARIQACAPALRQGAAGRHGRNRGEWLAVQRRRRAGLADVRGVDRAPVQHPDTGCQLGRGQLAELVADRLADLLRVG